MMMMDYLPWMNNEVFNICGQHLYIYVRYACVIHITRSGGVHLYAYMIWSYESMIHHSSGKNNIERISSRARRFQLFSEKHFFK